MIRFIRTIPSTLENNRAKCLTLLRNACPDPWKIIWRNCKCQNMQTILEQGQICVRQRCEMCTVSITLLYIYGNQLKGGTFTNREDPDAKLKSHIMLHFIRVYTVCYGKKRAPGIKIQYFRKVHLTPLFLYNDLSQVNNCFKQERKILLISIQKFKFKRMSCELCLI